MGFAFCVPTELQSHPPPLLQLGILLLGGVKSVLEIVLEKFHALSLKCACIRSFVASEKGSNKVVQFK